MTQLEVNQSGSKLDAQDWVQKGQSFYHIFASLFLSFTLVVSAVLLSLWDYIALSLSLSFSTRAR